MIQTYDKTLVVAMGVLSYLNTYKVISWHNPIWITEQSKSDHGYIWITLT